MLILFLIFFLLLILSAGFLVVGLISPGKFNSEGKPEFTRKTAGCGFGFFVVLFFTLSTITAAKVPKSSVTTSKSPTPTTKITPVEKTAPTSTATSIPLRTPAATPQPTTQPTTVTAQPQTSSPSPNNGITLTGYGALLTDWNKVHTEDTRYAPNSAYNPDPGLGTDDRHNSHYYSVGVTNNRVLSYHMRFSQGSSLKTAEKILMQEFPDDSKVVWRANKDTCAQMEIQSNQLTQTLGPLPIGDKEGMVFVEFSTYTSSSPDGYDSSNVNEAILNLGSYSNSQDAPGC